MSRLTAATLVLLCLPTVSVAGAITVSPSCGSPQTHFFVSAGGFRTPCACSDCVPAIYLSVDCCSVYALTQATGCLTDAGTFDLQTSPMQCGPYCPSIFTPGVHVATAYVIGDCLMPGGEYEGYYECVQTTYTVVASVPDPWANGSHLYTDIAGRDSVVITFNPPASCGVADCQAVYLIQSTRLRGIVGSDTLCVPMNTFTYSHVSAAELEKRNATLTSACVRIDADASEADPYMNGDIDGQDIGAHGSSGPTPSPSWTWDSPEATSTDTLLMEFEVDAYCGKGQNRGEFLGKLFWIYKVSPGSVGTAMLDPRRGADLGGPTPEFREAYALWLRVIRGSNPANPRIPSKGGNVCP